MRDYSGEGSTFRHLNGCERLRQRTNLIELNQDRISRMFLNTAFETRRIRHEQIIAYQLDAITQALAQVRPALPIILGKAIFDSDNWVLVNPLLIEVHHLAGSQGATLSRQDIFALVIEFAGSRVHTQENIHARFVARRFDSRYNHLQRLAVGAE